MRKNIFLLAILFEIVFISGCTALDGKTETPLQTVTEPQQPTIPEPLPRQEEVPSLPEITLTPLQEVKCDRKTYHIPVIPAHALMHFVINSDQKDKIEILKIEGLTEEIVEIAKNEGNEQKIFELGFQEGSVTQPIMPGESILILETRLYTKDIAFNKIDTEIIATREGYNLRSMFDNESAEEQAFEITCKETE